MKFMNGAVIGLLFGLCWYSQAQQQTKNTSQRATNELAFQVVDKFFPPDLDDDNSEKYSCFDVYRTDRKGNPELIFAIYPEYPGRFLALRRGADGLYTAQDVTPTGFMPFSMYCHISTENITSSGEEAILVSLRSMSQFSGNFIFQWDGSQLTSIGPTKRRRSMLETSLSEVHFENIFGGDSFAIVSLGELAGEGPRYESVYTWENGRYALKTHSTYSERFAVGPHGSSSATVEFSLASKARGPYAIQIGNGDLEGNHRATEVQVFINGTQKVFQGEVNNQIGAYHVDLQGLKAVDNTLTVKLTGNPGAYIYLVVEDQANQQP